MKSEAAKIVKISEIIFDWYKKNKRDLPWRNTDDPYLIWLSEIIMQQTRVNQGLEYYLRFAEAYPDVYSLASAPDEEVMRHWQGLGYYSRARNLLNAARQVVKQYNGVFPSELESLKNLKGVGDYTAAAVASIAFKRAVAVVDGNVNRVISRIYAIDTPVNTSAGEKAIKQIAAELLNERDPGGHNQAMMEFGALQCTPINPECKLCPLNDTCQAFITKSVNMLPVKLKKGKPRLRYFTFLLLKDGNRVFINKRVEQDIWQELYEFPMIEHSESPVLEDLERYFEEFTGLLAGEYRITSVSDSIKHQLTHQTLYARFVHMDVLQENYKGKESWLLVNYNELGDYALPRLIDRYLETEAQRKG